MGDNVLTNIHELVDSDHLKNAIYVAGCGNMVKPGERAPDLATANNCTASIQGASRKGWIGSYPLLVLAMQNEPFNKVDGSDTAANKTMQVVDKVYDLAKQPSEDKSPVSYVCTSKENTCVKTPVTLGESSYAVIGWTNKNAHKTPEMNPNRAIPVDKPIAAILGYTDAQMNMDRYLDDGKTLQETVARIVQQNHGAETVEQAFKLCVANNKVPETKSECATIGARFGLIDALASGVRYRGTEFLGVQSTNTQVSATPSVARK